MSIVELLSSEQPLDSIRHPVFEEHTTTGSHESCIRTAPQQPGCELQQQHNHAIEERANSLLRASAYHSVRQVTCEVRGRALILCGHVPSYYMKQIAQHVVRELWQDIKLENQLQVD